MIVGLQADLPQPVHMHFLYPLLAPTTQRALRARLVGDPLVGATEHQHLDQLLENDSVGDTRAVAVQRMVGAVLGNTPTYAPPVETTKAQAPIEAC